MKSRGKMFISRLERRNSIESRLFQFYFNFVGTGCQRFEVFYLKLKFILVIEFFHYTYLLFK